MKGLFKIISSLVIGCVIGVLVVVPIIALINGESVSSVLSSFLSERLLRLLIVIPVAILAIILQLIIHEGGHLVAGLLTGYRFVSFRFLNFTLIRKDGRLQWRNYDLAGTGGQCLLAPPDRPYDQIDTRWYNAGGVLANILFSILGIILLIAFDMPVWLKVFWGVMVFIGLYYAITNGLPMKLSGMANDGYYLFHMEKNNADKRYFLNILKSNALNQEGLQPKDMPEDLYDLPEQLGDWKDPLYVGNRITSVSRLMNLHQWEEAYHLLTEMLRNKNDIMPLYVNEINCMMTVLCIAMGRDDEAKRYYDKTTTNYVNQHAPTQSDKRLVKFAAALALDNDRPEAEKIYNELLADRDKFIHQGDVAMTIDLMQHLLDCRNAKA